MDVIGLFILIPNLPIKLFNKLLLIFLVSVSLDSTLDLYISLTYPLNTSYSLLNVYPYLTSILYPLACANFNSSLKYQPDHLPFGNDTDPDPYLIGRRPIRDGTKQIIDDVI